MCSKQFTKQTFAFLHQVNENRRLLAIDLKVAVTLTRYFNEKDNGGRAYPSCDTIAKHAGVSEHTVLRSVDRLEADGHLRIVWGRPGRSHPNQYWMIVKPAPTQVLDPIVSDKKPAPVKIKPAPVQENLLKNHERDLLQRSPLRGREREDQPSADLFSPPGAALPLTGAAPVEDQPETVTLAPSERLAPQENGFAELRALWRRGHPADDTDKAVAAARAAYAKALAEGALAEQIFESAKQWVAAADAPRFLPALPTWLAGQGYLKPPPQKKPAREVARGNGGHRNYRNGGKPDMARMMLALVEGEA
jgi:hypothetical protein